MTCPTRLPALLLPFLLVATSISASPPALTQDEPVPAAINGKDGQLHEAMLLVSLNDGTVIKQVIQVKADICFKQSSSSSTTCFTQGDAIVDAATDTVIGFEMIEDRIDLIAKQD